MSQELSQAERARYARHLMLPQVGEEGQKRLRDGSILVIGAGGLGSPVLLYLAAAGIGKIGIVDDDNVDITNLQRQIIHATASIGQPKVSSAVARIKQLNPDIEVVEYNLRLDFSNALEIIDGWNVVVDGTDNFVTRYTINDACEILDVPWVFGSIHRFEGQISVFNYQGGPNYRDLFPTAPPPELAPNCAEAGVLGVLPGMVGTIQATEALKIILGVGEALSGKLMTLDAITMNMRALSFEANPNRQPVKEMSEESIESACKSQTPKVVTPNNSMQITPNEFVNKKTNGWEPFFLDVRRQNEESIISLPNTNLRIEHTSVPKRSSEIPNNRDIVVYCRVGGRSEVVANWLIQSGWDHSRVWNLAGGIHLWADQIDSSIPKY